MALTGAVGAINVKVSADAAGFNATMNQVGNKVTRTAKKVRDASVTYQKWGAVAAAAALAVGTAMVKSQMKVLDSLAKTSDALGVQQKQLQALQHVAELTGTGAAQLSVNLERMQRRIGEVARKGGQAAAALSEIGISASEMIELPADEQLVRISQAMQGVTNSSIKASIAMDLFGRDGVRMLKMMEQLGKNGLAPTVEELEKMGVSLSRLDTAKVEQANDALFRTQQVTDGVINKIAIKLSPLIEAMAGDFLDAAKDANGFGSTIDNVMSKALTVVGVFADGLHGINIVFSSLKVGAFALSKIVNESFRIMAKGVEGFINLAIFNVNGLINAINMIPGVAIPAIEKFESAAAKMMEGFSQKASENLTGAIDELHNKAMEKIPSEQLDAYVAKAEEMATKAAAAAIAGNEGGGGGVGLSDADKVKMQEKLAAITESLMSETELKRLALETDAIVLQDALANQLLTQTEHDQQLVALVAQTNGEITAIEEKAKNDRLRIAEAEKMAKMSALGGAFKSLSSLMNTESKKMFEIGKAAAVAGALVDAYAAVTGAYKVGASIGGPVLGAAYAAAAGIAQAVNIQNIAKQKIGGAQAMGATASFSGGVPTNNGGGSSGAGRDRNISIAGLDPGALFSGEQIRNLLKNLAGDGADFTFLTNGG
jgi:hypothetical protein